MTASTKVTQLQIDTLAAGITNLNAGGQRFAASMIRQFNRKGNLTLNQEPYVFQLIAQINAPAPKPVTKKVRGDMAKLYNFFHQARTHLKYPKIVLSADLGGPGLEAVKLHMSGAKSAKPNTVNISLSDRPGKYNNGAWVGRVEADGNWDLPQHVAMRDPAMVEPIKTLLEDLGKDPHKVAAAHGKLTGACCFCNRHLEDERSTGVGYGPSCAEKWGLKKQWKAGAGVASVKKPAGTRKVTVRASK